MFPQDQASADKDGKENASTVHTRDGLRKAKARIVLLGYEHPALGEASYQPCVLSFGSQADVPSRLPTRLET